MMDEDRVDEDSLDDESSAFTDEELEEDEKY